jgi:protein-histidine pros-kinase
MTLKAKFNIVMLAAFLVGLGLAALFSYTLVQQEARQDVLQDARLMIDEAAAVRGYTDKQVGPLLEAQSGVRFLPQTIPFFAAQTVFHGLPASYHDYAYKEAALNPTNPADRATDWQADIIGVFAQHPDMKELVTVRQTPVGPTLNLARPVGVDSAACLTCHSTPQAAPAAMVNLYGTANGFGWNLHQVVGAQIVTVPMAVAIDKAQHMFIMVMGGLAVVFALMLVLMNALLHFLIVRPVRRISAAANEVSLGNLDVPEFEPRGRDEIATLAASFNRMRRSLASAMRLLDPSP